MNLTGKQFRMVTNMKAAPNSQGTLFQGGNAQRNPRGYTPERQAEVLGNLHPNTSAAMKSSETTRAVVGTVTRSTVPAETIRNVQFSGAGGPMRVARGSYSGLAVGGTYQGGTRFSDDFKQMTLTGKVTVAPGQEAGSTPIHELGHHESRLLGRKSAEYNTPARKGADEGFAETYAETHFRDRRGRPDVTFDTTPRKWTSNMGSASATTFAKHFQAERTGTPSRQRDFDAARQHKILADNKQEPLLHIHDLPESVQSQQRVLSQRKLRAGQQATPSARIHSAIDDLLNSARRK